MGKTALDFRVHPELLHHLRELRKDEFDDLERSILREKGARPGSLIVAELPKGERWLCDGHNTLRICQNHRLPIPKPRTLLFDTLDEVKAWMIENQLARRNYDEKAIDKFRQDRVRRIEEATKNGESINGIAKKEGVSTFTVKGVRRQVAGHRKRNPKKCTGVLGSTLPSRTTEKANGIKTEATFESPKLVDSHLLPNRVKDAFEDSTLGDLKEVLQSFLIRIGVDGLRKSIAKKARHYPFLHHLASALDGHLSQAQWEVTQALNIVEAGMPVGVCPPCKGAGCSVCRSSGLLPLKEYEAERKKHA